MVFFEGYLLDAPHGPALIDKAIAMAKDNGNELQTNDYHGITAYKAGPGGFAIVGPWLIAANNGELGRVLLDNLRLDKTGNALAKDNEFIKARKQAMDADLLVINHHLYFSDLALKEDGFGDLLPDAELLVSQRHPLGRGAGPILQRADQRGRRHAAPPT